MLSLFIQLLERMLGVDKRTVRGMPNQEGIGSKQMVMGRLGYGELGCGSNAHFVLLFSMEQEV